MRVTILYFASLREGLGIDREVLQLPAAVGTAGALRGWLRQRDGRWRELLGESRAVRVAVDQQMAGADAPLHDGAEVAFFPPVTGG